MSECPIRPRAKNASAQLTSCVDAAVKAPRWKMAPMSGWPSTMRPAVAGRTMATSVRIIDISVWRSSANSPHAACAENVGKTAVPTACAKMPCGSSMRRQA